VRVVDGRPEAGRFISEAAYALYVRGALAEAMGDWGVALRNFVWAASEDPESPEIWTRIGAVHCKASQALRKAPLASSSSTPAAFAMVPPLAAEAFQRARAIDPAYGPLYRERARCLLARGQGDAALDDAERALALDPDDLETALVRAEALEAGGRKDDARRALRALTIRRPDAPLPWSALLESARRSNDAVLAREAEEHLEALATPPRRGAAAADVDAALRVRNLGEARRRAVRGRVPSAEVAVRAAALGIADLAREQAEIVVAADPADASARIALVAAADLRGDMTALADAMRGLPRRSTPPSPLARWLLAEVLRRRVGNEAALAWLGSEGGELDGDGDPLLLATEKRVREALGAPRH
jgi:tetratricopeptide (TPR) repeat protein